MAAATVFNVIGVFSAVVGLVGFTQSNLPNKKVHSGDSSVRVAVALDGVEGQSPLRHAPGDAPFIQAYNQNGDYLGDNGMRYGGPYIKSGTFLDMVIEQGKHGPGEQATILQIIPTTNELCIAYIGQTWADGTHRGWTGDMGKGCDKDWYWSNVMVGDDRVSTCTWIDLDHSHGIETAALQIYMQDFTPHSDYSKDPADYCRYPVMLFKKSWWWMLRGQIKTPPGLWNNSDAVGDSTDILNDGTSVDPQKAKRRLARRSGSAAFTHLIASTHETHSARELCESGASHGPDFVSFSEGFFCDMDTKTHWPLCTGAMNGTTETETETAQGQVLVDCYHWDTHTLVLGVGAEDQIARNYSHVMEWD